MNNLKRFLALVLAMSMMLTAVPFGVFAADDAPAITGTTDAPFKQGTGESNSFRIPAMVTLSDGTLVAAADARWNTTYDGGGLDTMVAISKDNGKTWTHSFANYLGDNGNAYNGSSSTAFIDPALAVTSNDTIYMLVDLYPYGIALNGLYNTHPNSDIGFTDAGYLKLRDKNTNSFDYYLKDGKIYPNGSETALSGYTVDAYFNITNPDYNIDSNLFYADSIFKVARTGFLYLTKSTDGGETWSAPTLLNLKTGSERVCLVGPGRGLVTKNGTIVFPVYSYAGDPTNTDAYTEQRMGFIYSTDGTNWQRSANLDYQWASESAVVELNDGTLRFFFRNGNKKVMYVDYNMTSQTWGTPVNTGVASNSNTQVSAISLNQTVDGKQVILVSCPASSDADGSNQSGAAYRTNGKIHLFTVGENNALTKVSTVDVPSVHSTNSFMYSCLTAQKDAAGNETGDISILYEDQESQWGTGANCYYQMSFKTFDVEESFGVTLEGAVTRETVDVTLKVGETVTKTIDGVALNGSNTDTSVATVTWTGSTGEGGTTEVLTPVTLPTSAGSVEAYISDGNGNYLSLSNRNLVNVTDRANATKWTISWHDTPTWHDGTSRYQVKSGSYYVNMVNGVLDVNTSNSGADVNHWYTAENGFYGGYMGTNGWQFNGTSWTINTSGYGNANAYTPQTVTEEGDKSTTVTITGKGVGNTKVEVGNTIYNITVTRDFDKEINVELHVGETSETYTDTTGNYENDTNNVAPNAAIAEMKVEGTTTAGDATITPVTALTAGDTFYIQVTDGEYLTADLETTTNLSDAELWKVVDGGNTWGTIQNSNGKWLAISDNKVVLSNYFYYLWLTNGKIGDDWGTVTAGTPVKATESEPIAATDITFTGVAAGETVAYVGMTKYNITVSPAGVDAVVDIELEIGEDFTYTDTTGVYGDDDITEQPDGTYATMVVTPTSNSVTKKLVEVTELNFETGKRYVIENVRTVNKDHDAYQPHCSVLTSTEAYGGLVMNGPLDMASSQTWTFTSDSYGYLIGANSQYIHVADGSASMETNGQTLRLNYIEGKGWLIYDNTDDDYEPADGDIFLSDVNGINSGEAKGLTVSEDDGNYWNIYELVEEEKIDSTKVTFTGVAVGKTTAVVGGTLYNITVVASELDDEVMNSATGIWTVDPEVQWDHYNKMIGLKKDLYTDASWRAYEDARQAAFKQLVEVTNGKYTSQAAAEGALKKATELVDALEEAYKNLVAAKTISVRYKLGDDVLDIREYKVESTASSLALPETIVVDEHIYEVSTTNLTLDPNETTYEVSVTLVGKMGGGFVASADLPTDANSTSAPVVDLVAADGTHRKITELTLTVGTVFTSLDLATDTTGYTVTWSSEHGNIATVADGVVTATGTGTTYITATVTDADGNIVEINTIPVNVYPKGTGERVTGMYVDNIENTTVWCVVNADTENYAFEVVEGELIYGQFDKTVSGGTKTTAISFFGDPDEAHALVAMASTDSFGDYYQLHDGNGDVGIGSEYYVTHGSSGAGYWQALGLNNNSTPNWDLIEDMVDWAIDQGCDGGLGFTRRQNEGNTASILSFTSDPMPRIEKTVNGVLPTSRKQADFRRYTDGMVAAVHELVYFEITITQELPLVWEPLRDSNNKVEKDDDGNAVLKYDENGNPYGAVGYSDAWVKDTVLPGAYLYTKELDQADGTWDGEIAEGFREQTDEITTELNSAWTAEQRAAGVRTFSYYLVYEIKEEDIPKFYIDNIATLEYGYKSAYSSGAQQGVADAEARISVVGTAIDDVVIDFGQSFAYEGHDYTCITDDQSYTFEGLTNTHLKGVYVDGDNDEDILNADGTPRTTSHAEANYGTVEVKRFQTTDENGNTHDEKGYPLYKYVVTYTPTQILQDVDTVRLYGVGEGGREKVINAFRVYPATTVYYEEGFILSDGQTWNDDNAKKATVNQTFELLGDSQFNTHGELTGKVSNKKNAYGFDPIYDGVKSDTNLEVEKSYISSNTIGDKTSFTFTGNGFEIFADCTTSTGRVSVQVKNSAGERVKIFNVNTIVAERLTETGDSTDGQNTDFDSLPIVSWHTTIHDTYTVTITKIMDTDTVMIDGVRVFNTVNERKYDNDDGTPNSPFSIDLEDAPEFFQLRDYVLSALVVKDDTSVDYGTVQEMAGQVYDQVTSEGEAPAVILAKSNGYYTGTDEVQNLLDNGPKNELYLHRGETLVFSVTTSRIMQVGLKAPVASTTYSISYEVDGVTTTPANNVALNTSVDMFYELKNSNGAAKTYTITITNNGNEILSVTDLKICDDPNAAFVALTVDDIKTALEVMGYSDSCEAGHSFENGFCTVCGMGSVRNTTTGVEYGTVGEALAAAKDGEIVILLTDCTESTAMVTSGVTLDLNGFQLTASYAVAMDGAHIIDSTGNGSLVIGEKALILDEENTMIPVYNGEGYVFTKAGFAVRQDTAYTGEGIKINAMAYPVQMAVVDLLKNGGADNNIEIVIRLTWDTDQGTGSQDFKFTDEVVSSVYSSNQGAWNKYSKMFSMVVTGFESIENLKANIIVVSGTDAEYVSSTSVDIT